jgi:hypothetical protein
VRVLVPSLLFSPSILAQVAAPAGTGQSRYRGQVKRYFRIGGHSEDRRGRRHWDVINAG